MCLAILLHRQIDGFPVVFGANREEAYARSSLAPHWFGDPPLFAGRDEVAGGTWLGVNRHGLLVAVTNRHDGAGVQADPGKLRSRGLLCRDVLSCDSARAAAHWVEDHLGSERYNPFNLMLVDGNDALVVHGSIRRAVVELEPGRHVLSETDVDDAENERVARAFGLLDGRLDEVSTSDASATAEAVLQSVLGEHGDEERQHEWMCRHLTHGGTVSSAVIGLAQEGLSRSRYLFAPGPPCSTPFQDLTVDLQNSGEPGVGRAVGRA